MSVAENSTAVTTVTATDPDAGTTLSYSIVGGADAAKFSINASTGALAFVTAPNFEAPADAGRNNVYDVIVQVSDGTLTDTQAIAVTVTNQNEAPVDHLQRRRSDGVGVGCGEQHGGDHGDGHRSRCRHDAELLDRGRRRRGQVQHQCLDRRAGLRDGAELRGAGRCRPQQRLRRHVQVSDGTLHRYPGDRRHGDQPERGAGHHLQRRRSDGVGVGCGEQHGGDHGDGDRSRCRHDAELLDRGRAPTRPSSRINATTGALAFVTAPNFEAPADAGRNNVYDVTVQVSDGTLHRYPSDRRHGDQPERGAGRSPPTAAERRRSVSVAENSTAVTTVTATDPDAGRR